MVEVDIQSTSFERAKNAKSIKSTPIMDFKKLNKSKEKPEILKDLESTISEAGKKVGKTSKEVRKSRTQTSVRKDKR